MSKLNAVGQKLKGKAQKAVGEYYIQTGKKVKGGIAKAKGEVNERLADAKMRLETNQNRERDSFDEDDDFII